jgi:hypothetical protein
MSPPTDSVVHRVVRPNEALQNDGCQEPAQSAWREAPSSGRRRLKAPARGGPVGAAALGGTEPARRPLSASGALVGSADTIGAAASESLPHLMSLSKP